MFLQRSAVPVILFFSFGRPGMAVELKSETVLEFNKVITSVEARLEARFGGQQFLWSDEFPGLKQQLLDGVVIAQPIKGNGIIPIKGGLVQDWRGAVFVPHASLRDVLTIVQDYDHHREIYKPDVAEAKIESRKGDEFLVFMRIVKSKFMFSDVLDTENAIRFIRLDARRVYSRSYSKRINEVAAAGQASEHELPSGQDRGLLWRLNGYWFFEERDEGVYITCESITLTRDIPFGMGTLLGPVIHDMPGESLRKSLEQTRRAVVSLRP